MWPIILISAYCVLVALASLFGGSLPSKMRLTHTEMQTIMSFVGGLVLGVGLLHLLPHSVAETSSIDTTVRAALIGLLTMFLLIRIFQVHQHGPVDQSTTLGGLPECAHGCGHEHEHEGDDEHRHEHGHGHAHQCGHEDEDEHRQHHVPEPCAQTPEYPVDGQLCAAHRHQYSWIGLGAGLALHTMIDGMALAASVTASARHEGADWKLLGVGTFLAVLLHKPLDAMSITSVMVAGGWSAKAQWMVNLGFASMCAAGAAAFFLGIQQFGDQQQMLVGAALGFAAGVFLCISLADILPEVQFHAHDRVKLTAALLLGTLLAVLIGFLEPAHMHGYGTGFPEPAAQQQQLE